MPTFSHPDLSASTSIGGFQHFPAWLLTTLREGGSLCCLGGESDRDSRDGVFPVKRKQWATHSLLLCRWRNFCLCLSYSGFLCVLSLQTFWFWRTDTKPDVHCWCFRLLNIFCQLSMEIRKTHCQWWKPCRKLWCPGLQKLTDCQTALYSCTVWSENQTNAKQTVVKKKTWAWLHSAPKTLWHLVWLTEVGHSLFNLCDSTWMHHSILKHVQHTTSLPENSPWRKHCFAN